jgi:gamma-glutamylcyclotransferase (GGCT)/AIG2-like uncharacterized protein YtfP
MSFKQMQSRCKSAVHFCNASKKNYELCFPITSVKREGKGVASIRRKMNTVVEGVVFSISVEDLIVLDSYEGKNYNRRKIFVDTKLGRILVWCYFATNDNGNFFPPSDDYIETIIKGAIQHNISKKYIEFLKSFTFI